MGRVVDIADRRGLGEAAHPALQQIRAYWQALRQSGTLPERAEIDPRGIERALDHAFIAERIAPGVARFRLAGMQLNGILGMEVRGMPLTVFFEPIMRDEVQRQTERAFSEPAAVEMRLEAVRGIGRPDLQARLLLLPLRDEAGQVARVLGGFAAMGEIGRTPRRFRLLGAEAQPCFAKPAAQLSANPIGEGAPRAPAFARGHLRLVHSESAV
jgi:hypothetical protein